MPRFLSRSILFSVFCCTQCLVPVASALAGDVASAPIAVVPDDANHAASAPAAAAPGGNAPTKKPSLWDNIKKTTAATWDSKQYELYIPLHTWHNRRHYDADKIASYNENPWGIGIGKYRFDDQGDWHGIYAMAFLDSHSRIEPVSGYGYEKMWRPNADWRFGAGFTAGFTARQDYHYLPIPLILPLLSIEYKRFALQTTYIPGGHNYGNVLFTWARWEL